MTEFVYPEWFGMGTTDSDRSEFKSWMEPVTHVYSKGMATLAEGAVSKASAVIYLRLCCCCCCTRALLSRTLFLFPIEVASAILLLRGPYGTLLK